MPTYTELINIGRIDLARAIGKHGGFPVVAQRLGLERPGAARPAGYWADFANVANELRAFMAEHDTNGNMPTLHWLNTTGHSSLISAIIAHGGFFFVAHRLGIVYTGREYIAPRTASSVERTARAIQPLAESNLLSPAQVMVILRRAGLLEFRN